MHPENTITNELLEYDAAILIPLRQFPYHLPDDYFLQLPNHIITMVSGVNDDIKLIASKGNPHMLPQEYFDSLATIIMNRINEADGIINDTKSFLVEAKRMPYAVPDAYFNTLPEGVLRNINNTVGACDEELNEVSPFLKYYKSYQPYAIPDGYFNSLTEDVLASVTADAINPNEELETLSPLLAGIKNSKTFEVPDGYFNEVIKAENHEANSNEKTVPFSSRKQKRWTGALAASVLILLSFTGLRFFNNDSNPDIKPQHVASTSVSSYQKQLAQVSDVDIKSYIESNLDDFDENTLVNSLTKKNISLDSRSLLDDISDEEIEEYLEGNL